MIALARLLQETLFDSRSTGIGIARLVRQGRKGFRVGPRCFRRLRPRGRRRTVQDNTPRARARA